MTEQAIEIVRFRVEAAVAERFVRERGSADQALAPFAGFLGSELAQVDEAHWVLIVRWASAADAAAAQRVTLSKNSPPALGAWIGLAAEVVSFETATLRRTSVAPGGSLDSQQTNLDVATRFVTQALGRGDLGSVDELVAADVVVTTGLSPKEPIRGRDAYKQILAGFAEAWPVQRLVIDDLFASGDKVVVRFTATAVFRKDYFGVQAGQQVVPLKEVHVLTVRGGKIVENLVAAVNLPYEFIMYPALKDAVLGGLEVAP